MAIRMMLTTEIMTTTSSPCDRCRHITSDRYCHILEVAIAEHPPCHYWYRKEFSRGIEFELTTIEDLIDGHKAKGVS